MESLLRASFFQHCIVRLIGAIHFMQPTIIMVKIAFKPQLRSTVWRLMLAIGANNRKVIQ